MTGYPTKVDNDAAREKNRVSLIMASIRRRSVLLILGGAIFLGLVTFVGLKIIHSNHAAKAPKVTNQTVPKAKEPPQTVASEAEALSHEKGYPAAQAYIDEQVAKATDSKQKGSLFEDKSLLAFNNKDYANAFEYAKTAESLSPTINSVSLAAQSAEKAGDKSSAVKYYQLTIARMEQTKKPFVDEITDYTNKIQELSK